MHTDVCDVVEFAEDAQLREFGYSCEENEVQHRFILFQRTEEVAHDVAQISYLFVLVGNIEQRRVVFVDKHHHLLPGNLKNPLYEIVQSDVDVDGFVVVESVFSFVLSKHRI